MDDGLQRHTNSMSFIRFLLGPSGSADSGQVLLRSVEKFFAGYHLDSHKYVDEYFAKVWNEISKNPAHIARTTQTIRFLLDDRALDDAEAASYLEYIRHHLIAKFQGAYMELLALHSLRNIATQFENKLGVPVVPWLGSEVQVPILHKDGSFSPRYDQGPDAVWVSEGSSARTLLETLCTNHQAARIPLIIIAVGEIKSYRASMRRVSEQMHKHLRRLAGGVDHHGYHYSPDCIYFLLNIGGHEVILSAMSAGRGSEWIKDVPAKIIFMPHANSPSAGNASRLRRSTGLWHIDLEASRSVISDVGHALSIFFLESLACQAGREALQCPPYLSVDEHVHDAMKRSLYYLYSRENTSNRSFFLVERLYNYYSYGLRESAKADAMLYPEDVHARNSYLRIVIPSNISPEAYIETVLSRATEVRNGNYSTIHLHVPTEKITYVRDLLSDAECLDVCTLLPYDGIVDWFPTNFVVVVSDPCGSIWYDDIPAQFDNKSKHKTIQGQLNG